MNNIATFGFDYNVSDDNGLMYSMFRPFPNKHKLDKTDIELEYTNIERTFTDEFTIEPLSWDMPFEFKKIDFLTLLSDKNFLIKLESKTAPSIGINKFLHLAFDKGITKFYLSNPNQESLNIQIIYLSNSNTSDRITNVLYKKTDTLNYWHITHNLGIEPVYVFLDDTGTEVEPDYTIELYNENEIIFNFTTGFTGFVFFDHYQSFDFTISDTWSITHNLDKYPSVLVFDDLGGAVTDFTKIYNDNNTLTLTFETPLAGKALIN